MDELFDYPIDSPALREALDQRIEHAYLIVEANSRPLSRPEFEAEFEAWDAELEPLGDSMRGLLDEVADEVEASLEAQHPTCFGGLVALRMMQWARERLEPDPAEEVDFAQLGMDLNVFVSGWQFLKVLQSQ